MARHGPLGTPESRLQGGRSSYATRKDIPNDIFARTSIHTPDRDERLAEFFGIMIGDGNITKYQASIALSYLVALEYCAYVAGLFFELFGLCPSVTKKGSTNCLVITASSINLAEFLVENGLSLGDKLKHNLDIPAWIMDDRSLRVACARGIFDTDGCVFWECHTINEKQYCYPRLSFVSMSPALRASLYEILLDLEFEPKIRNNRSVNLERRTDIAGYFQRVGSSNPKHIRRWHKFGEVA